jgi:hypothetical protein
MAPGCEDQVVLSFGTVVPSRICPITRLTVLSASWRALAWPELAKEDNRSVDAVVMKATKSAESRTSMERTITNATPRACDRSREFDRGWE